MEARRQEMARDFHRLTAEERSRALLEQAYFEDAAFTADWIEDLYNRAITGGCSASPLLYCPGNPNTRGQMAAFLVRTFGL